MPKFEITAPDGRRFEITAPEGATQEQALAYAQQQYQAKPAEKPYNPTDDMTTGEKFLAGTGKAFVDLGRGVKQRLGFMSEQEVAEARKVDAPLMGTGAGVAGNLAGTIAALGPTMMVPGANTVAGAALVGGLSGGLQPTAEGESATKNALAGAALGGGAQYGVGKLASMASNRLANVSAKEATRASQNSIRDATLQSSKDAGYVIPPSLSEAGTLPRMMEGVSGKFKTNQAAAIKNQNVTDSLARKALGLADDQPITREALQEVRSKAFQVGYEPLNGIGAVSTDKAYETALNRIVADLRGAERSFPGAVKSEVGGLVENLRVPGFDSGDAVKMIRVLREEAGKAYAAGDKTMGKANKAAADAIEDQIERALQGAGKEGAEALKAFRDARTLMAKTFNVEKAIVEAGGHVNAKVLGAALQKGKPLSGELRTIGAFANNFKDVAGVPQSGFANPITALDAFGAAAMGAGGAGLGAVAFPAARIASRSAVLSGPMQRAMGPTYGPSAATRMSPELLRLLEERGGGGLLSAVGLRFANSE